VTDSKRIFKIFIKFSTSDNKYHGYRPGHNDKMLSMSIHTQ